MNWLDIFRRWWRNAAALIGLICLATSAMLWSLMAGLVVVGIELLAVAFLTALAEEPDDGNATG